MEEQEEYAGEYSCCVWLLVLVAILIVVACYTGAPYEWGTIAAICVISILVLIIGIPIGIVLTLVESERKKQRKLEKKRLELEKKEFEKKQKEKGLVKFISSDGTERWGMPKQVKKWKEVEVGLSNNFADYTPYEFEKFITELFKKIGYVVELTPPAKDYGVDVVAKKGGNTIAIQVKKYAMGNNVGAKEIQQALGAMWKVKADQAIFITTSGFSVYAREQAKEAPVELWDKKILHEMVRKYYIENEG